MADAGAAPGGPSGDPLADLSLTPPGRRRILGWSAGVGAAGRARGGIGQRRLGFCMGRDGGTMEH